MMRRCTLPGSTIGILGGGQLGRMMVLEGRRMGYQFITLDPAPNSPCGQICPQIQAAYTDLDAARELAQRSDLITYEFENVSSQVTQVLEREGYVPQGYQLLATTQDRLKEKGAISALGIPVAPYRQVETEGDLLEFTREHGYPVVLKTATGGYDGKGQTVIRDLPGLQKAAQQLSPECRWVVEAFIPFERELSAIVARSPRGEVAVFPIAENIHQENILHLSIVPARIPDQVQAQAREMAIALAEGLGVIGLLAVEFFYHPEQGLFVNETAPRPHNSGHYTYDACMTSQFEQHLRAVCNLALGSTELLSPVVMVNVLGEHLVPIVDKVQDLPPNFKLHLYGKEEAKIGRKMGHLTGLGETQLVLDQIAALKIW